VSKYGNRKCKLTIDGQSMTFDSVAERTRAIELVEMRDAGCIDGLIFQPAFILQDRFEHNGKHHRAIKYVADFRYIKNKKTIVEDVKGMETDVYKMKRKLFIKLFKPNFIESRLKRGRFEFVEY